MNYVQRFVILYSSVYSCHLFLISSASCRSKQFLSFIEPIFCMKCYLGISNFFEEISSLSYFIVFLYLRKAFLSLLAILWNSAFKWVYLSFYPLLLFFSSLFVRSPQTAILFSFFFLGMALIHVSCTISRTSAHSSSGTLSMRSSPLNLVLTSTV